MNSRLYWLIVVLMLGSIVIGACATRFPLGDYEPEHKLDADWISFRAEGRYVIAIEPREIAGTYVVDGDKIVLNEQSGVGLNHPGTYHWEIHGNALTLKAIDDQCTASERATDLSRTWDRQP